MISDSAGEALRAHAGPAGRPRDLVAHWRSERFRDAARSWAHEVLIDLGYEVVGPLTEHRVRFWSAVFTMVTDRGKVWFKATNPGQRFEAGVSEVLARLVPDDVLAPLAVDAGRGWLLLPDGGRTLRDRGEVTPADWEALVVQAARMQRTLVPHERALTGAGLPALTPAQAAGYVTGVVEELTELPADHPQHLDVRTARRLLTELGAVRRSFDDLDSSGVPLTLQPNDVSAANAFPCGRGHGQFAMFDLGDAFWSHPFAMLQVPTRMATGAWPERPRADHPLAVRLRSVCGRQWGFSPGADLERLIDAADRLASLHRCQSWRRLLAHVDVDRLGTATPLLVAWLADAVRPPGP